MSGLRSCSQLTLSTSLQQLCTAECTYREMNQQSESLSVIKFSPCVACGPFRLFKLFLQKVKWVLLIKGLVISFCLLVLFGCFLQNRAPRGMVAVQCWFRRTPCAVQTSIVNPNASDSVCDAFSAVTSEPDAFLFGQAELGLSYTLAVWKSQIQCFCLNVLFHSSESTLLGIFQSLTFPIWGGGGE